MAAGSWLLAAIGLATFHPPPGNTARGNEQPPATRVSESARASGPNRAIVWRALESLRTAKVDAPGLVQSYRRLLRSGSLFNRNPLDDHPGDLDRLDLLVTKRTSARRRSYELRQSLYLPAPSQATFPLQLPSGARLRFGLSRAGRRARGRVRIGDRVVWEGVSTRRWTEVEVDLSQFAGRSVGLTLESTGSGHVFFADPAISAPRPGGPNILLVVVDTLATWALGCYGQPAPISPNLDRLCREGTTFDQAIANANWTRPSVVSFLSSWLPGKVGISYNQFFGLNIAPQRKKFYERRPALLPRLMRRGGYRTAAIVNNLFLLGYHKYGVDVGFDEVVDFRRHVADTVDISDRALRWLKRHRDERFFLMLNYNAPHVHYAPPGRYAAQVRPHLRGVGPRTRAYLGEVRFTDAEVKRVLDGLDQLGLARDTVVILTADHGEVHDPKHAYRVTRTGRHSRYSHAVTMYDEEVRVPLVLRWPGRLPAGKRIADQVRLLDLAPTILELAKLPPAKKHQGKSVLNLVRGERENGQRIAFIEGRMMRAVRAEGFKYFKRLKGYDRIAQRGRVRKVAEELYDLARDPAEYRNLAALPQQRAKLERLRALSEKIEQELANPAAVAVPAPRVGVSSARKGLGRQRVHLRFVGDGKKRRFEGQLKVPGGVKHFRLSRHESQDAVWRDDAGVLHFRIEVERDRDDLWVEVGDLSEIHLALTLVGKVTPPLRVGPFGLPLLGPGLIAGENLALLHSQYPPTTRPGRELGVFLWTEGASSGRATRVVAGVSKGSSSAADDEERVRRGAANREVEGMLRDWGYIQGGRRRKSGGR